MKAYVKLVSILEDEGYAKVRIELEGHGKELLNMISDLVINTVVEAAKENNAEPESLLADLVVNMIERMERRDKRNGKK